MSVKRNNISVLLITKTHRKAQKINRSGNDEINYDNCDISYIGSTYPGSKTI